MVDSQASLLVLLLISHQRVKELTGIPPEYHTNCRQLPHTTPLQTDRSTPLRHLCVKNPGGVSGSCQLNTVWYFDVRLIDLVQETFKSVFAKTTKKSLTNSLYNTSSCSTKQKTTKLLTAGFVNKVTHLVGHVHIVVSCCEEFLFCCTLKVNEVIAESTAKKILPLIDKTKWKDKIVCKTQGKKNGSQGAQTCSCFDFWTEAVATFRAIRNLCIMSSEMKMLVSCQKQVISDLQD